MITPAMGRMSQNSSISRNTRPMGPACHRGRFSSVEADHGDEADKPSEWLVSAPANRFPLPCGFDEGVALPDVCASGHLVMHGPVGSVAGFDKQFAIRDPERVADQPHPEPVGPFVG